MDSRQSSGVVRPGERPARPDNSGFARPGTGFSSVEWIQLKIVVFAPIPSANVKMAIAANPGAFRIILRPYRASCQNEVMPHPATRS